MRRRRQGGFADREDDITVKFSGLTPANGFGQEYLTYVLWAISADGRPQNLGELVPAGDKDSLV